MTKDQLYNRMEMYKNKVASVGAGMDELAEIASSLPESTASQILERDLDSALFEIENTIDMISEVLVDINNIDVV